MLKIVIFLIQNAKLSEALFDLCVDLNKRGIRSKNEIL
jgi:hypothetical protein